MKNEHQKSSKRGVCIGGASPRADTIIIYYYCIYKQAKVVHGNIKMQQKFRTFEITS